MVLALDVKNLTRFYGTVKAVDGVSFQIEQGIIFGLLGPNGAGKSTIIKMVTTLLPPTSGTALVFGIDIVRQPAKVRENIGYVSQLISADDDLTGYENLLLSAKLYGLGKSERESRINEVLEFMGLQDVADRIVGHYSGGMIRRLEIGQALLHKPNILFLDEPSIGLDPTARKILWKNVREWRDRYGTTIFMTTHDMDEADKVCNRLGFMHEGNIVAIDSPSNLKKKVGPNATLDDVFQVYTGTSITGGDSYDHAKEIRAKISHLD